MAVTGGTNGIVVQQSDVFRVVQALVAGPNVIAHNSGFSPVMVEVRNNATGGIIAADITGESTNSVTITVAVPVTARISIDW